MYKGKDHPMTHLRRHRE